MVSARAARVVLCSLAATLLIATPKAHGSPNVTLGQVAVRATAVSGPFIDVSPAFHDFGRVNVGESSGEFDFTLSNTGVGTLNISSLDHTAPGFTMSAPPASIPEGGSVVLHASYAPQSGSGRQTDFVTIHCDAVNGNFIVLLVGTANNPPFFDPALAPEYDAYAFFPFSLTASATDPEGDALTWALTSVPPLPIGATFDGTNGALAWTPEFVDGGDYAVTITVSDGLTTIPSAFMLRAHAENRPPVAVPNGPYQGPVGFPLTFDGTHSSDPDAGQTLTFYWDFGDGTTGVGANPSHTYSAAGIYVVALTVTDDGTPALSSQPVPTTAEIVNFVTTTVVQPSGGVPVVKTNGNGTMRFGIECLSRPVTDINLDSMRVSTTYPHAGSVSEMRVSLRDAKVGDINHNLLGDLDFDLRASDLKPLLSHVPNNALVTLVFTSKAVSDKALFRGTIDVIKSGSASTAPLTASGLFEGRTTISYLLEADGRVTVRIYSVEGRLVRTLEDGGYASAGIHTVAWDGEDDRGGKVGSGLYFVKAFGPGSAAEMKIAVIR